MHTTEDALAIGSEPQLFIDDTIISATRGVVRTLHPARKLEQPVLRPDRPWEGRRVYIYGSVQYDCSAGLFRMWYNTRLGRGHQNRAPGLRSRTGDIILYATSEDGIHWDKPNLGRHEFDGTVSNNILLFDKHSPTVVVDTDARPDQRYKIACWNWEQGNDGYWVGFSADGLDWRGYDGNPILLDDDEILEAVTVAPPSEDG